MNSTTSTNHWHNHSKQWDKLSSPLRPNHEDLSFYQKHATKKSRNLILGLTPELCCLSGKSVFVDSCGDRIKLLFDKNSLDQHAIQAYWLHLPLTEQQFDNVFGDGVFTQLVYPTEYTALFNNINIQLKANGKLVSRIFINNEICTTAEEVVALANKGSIGSFHAFKWRFTMALLNERKETNIPVIDIYTLFNQYCPDRVSLSRNSNWDIKSINTIDVYKGSSSIYSFPTLSQLKTIMPNNFIEEAIHYGSYELAESCPIVVWGKLYD